MTLLSLLLVIQPAEAEKKVEPSSESTLIEQSLSEDWQSDFVLEAQSPLSTVNEELAPTTQAEIVEIAEITSVQVEEIEGEIRLILDSNGELSTPDTSTLGNETVAEIPNAVLNLSGDEDFFANDPADGIEVINITNLPDNRVRISITGSEAPPSIEISTSVAGVVVQITPADLATPKAELEILVLEEQNNYAVPNATTGTRTDTAILDTSQSVQVVPRRILEDQQVIRVDEALRNVSNVVGVLEPFGNGGNLTIRGFTADTFTAGAILRDGYRINDNLGTQDLANVERVEVLKGPSSVLYGQNNPGGIVNLVTKRPLNEALFDLGIEIGSFELVRPTIDVSLPLLEDGSLRSRINFAYTHEDGFRDFETETDRFFVAPVVTWDISDQASFTVVMEYVDEKLPFDTGLLAQGTGVFDVPSNRVIGSLDAFLKNESLTLGYDFQYQFSEDWTFNHGFRYIGQDYFIDGTLPFFVDETTGDATLFFADRQYLSDDYSIQANVVGEFNTGSVEHTLLVGADFNFNVFREPFTRIDFFQPGMLNVFNPDYSLLPDVDLNDVEPFFPPFNTDYQRYGFFLQDQVEIGEHVIVVGSLRYDIINYTEQTVVTDRRTEKLSPRVGLIYKPIETVSIYGNYSQSFEPNFGQSIDGNDFDPEEAEGLEFGVKAELLGGRIFTTLAYFDITKQNVLATDPDNALFSVLAGEQRSQGIEFDIVGEILSGWNIIANYAYTDARTTRDNEDPLGNSNEGNRLNNAPYNIFNLWTTYEIQSGDLQGLGFGIGFNYVGEREGDLANTFRVDDYFLMNMAVFYNQDNWRVALNIKNVFDSDFIKSTSNSRTFGIVPGQPFSVVGSIGIEF